MRSRTLKRQNIKFYYRETVFKYTYKLIPPTYTVYMYIKITTKYSQNNALLNSWLVWLSPQIEMFHNTDIRHFACRTRFSLLNPFDIGGASHVALEVCGQRQLVQFIVLIGTDAIPNGVSG